MNSDEKLKVEPDVSLDDCMDTSQVNESSRHLFTPKLRIAGIQKLSLVDYPGKTACTLFMSGCNFRCPFCHNSELADEDTEDIMSFQDLMSFLEDRKRVLDGVVISGGEPTLNPNLLPILKSIKDLGYSIKLDTNGYLPQVLSRVIDSHTVDYIAMDIKGSPRKYELITGTYFLYLTHLKQSIHLIMDSGIEYEFRTTFIDQFHDEQDVEDMASWIEGAKNYYLQSFTDRDTVPMKGLTAPSMEKLKRYQEIFKAHHIANVQIRGRDDNI